MLRVCDIPANEPDVDAVRDDPNHNAVLACAVASGAAVIVTSDEHLLRIGMFQGVTILRASDFLRHGG